MAVGSNTLGLLFNIKIDASSAEQVVKQLEGQSQQLIKQLVNQLKALNLETGVTEKETQALLETMTKLGLTEEQQKAVLKGFVDGYKEAKKAMQDTGDAADSTNKSLKSTNEALKEHQAATRTTITHLNQLKNAFDDIVHGNFGDAIGNIARGLASGNPLIIAAVVAVVALGAALFATTKFVEAFGDAVENIGTSTKSDFDDLQESLKRVHFQLTLADHALSQEIGKSLKDIGSIFTAMMAVIIREAGPAILTLLKDIGVLLQKLMPLATEIGIRINNLVVNMIALGKTMEAIKNLEDKGIGVKMSEAFKIFLGYAHQTQLEVNALGESFKNLTGDFDAVKHKKDLTEAQLDVNEAVRKLTLLQAQAVTEEGLLQRGLAANAITAEYALTRRLALQNSLFNLQVAVLDAERHRIETDTTLENKKADEIKKNDNDRKVLVEQDANRQAEISAQNLQDIRKERDFKLESIDKIAKGEEKIAEIVKNRAREQNQPAPLDIPAQVPGIPDEEHLPPLFRPSFLEELTKNFKSFGNAFVDVLTETGDAVINWGKLVGDIMSSVATTTQEVFQNFILTGHLGGQAFKALAAAIISSLAVQAAVEAILEVAHAAKEVALAQGDAAVGNIPGYVAHMRAAAAHTAAAVLYGKVAAVAAVVGIAIGAAGGLGGGGATAGAAAGGGGFGGAGQAPGTVTINQGAGATTLGVQVALLSEMNQKLGVITTAPPGDVVQRGADQNPLAIGQANNEAARRDGTVSRQFLEIAGLRPA